MDLCFHSFLAIWLCNSSFALVIYDVMFWVVNTVCDKGLDSVLKCVCFLLIVFQKVI